ncbi:MAG: hypothetical protein DBY36_01955 [Clostridiales bacterium]|nr:MAG: hypothetical protein DBY36_01955 [Clostridiales bacterium]
MRVFLICAAVLAGAGVTVWLFIDWKLKYYDKWEHNKQLLTKYLAGAFGVLLWIGFIVNRMLMPVERIYAGSSSIVALIFFMGGIGLSISLTDEYAKLKRNVETVLKRPRNDMVYITDAHTSIKCLIQDWNRSSDRLIRRLMYITMCIIPLLMAFFSFDANYRQFIENSEHYGEYDISWDNYIASCNSDVYHNSSCHYVGQIESDWVSFKTRGEAEKAGYHQCAACNEKVVRHNAIISGLKGIILDTSIISVISLWGIIDVHRRNKINQKIIKEYLAGEE